MRTYILSATLNGLTTTQAVHARDNFSAKVLAVNKINASYVSDKRYSKGEIVLKDPDGKVVWKIEQEEEPKIKKEGGESNK